MSSKQYDWNSVGLDFGNWDEDKIWALNLPTTEIDIQELLWHFDAPWWANDNNERWSITPWDVINKTPDSTSEQARVLKADLSYPIDLIKNEGKFLILDGIHLLVKAHLLGHTRIPAHIIPRERLPEITSNHPIELPSN